MGRHPATWGEEWRDASPVAAEGGCRATDWSIGRHAFFINAPPDLLGGNRTAPESTPTGHARIPTNALAWRDLRHTPCPNRFAMHSGTDTWRDASRQCLRDAGRSGFAAPAPGI